MTQPTTVTVKPGESLSLLAKRHGTTVAALAQANGIRQPNLVRAGAVLRLPGDALLLSPAAQAATQPPAKAAPAQAPAAAPSPSAKPSLRPDPELPTEADLTAMQARLAKQGIDRAWLERSCEQHGVPVPLALALIWKESKGKAQARSHAGAKGLMQLMPKTAAALGVRNPYDPKQNLSGGLRYLGAQLKRFGQVDLALAAYNAGPTRVAKLGRVPEIQETQNYVRKIQAWMPVGHESWQATCR